MRLALDVLLCFVLHCSATFCTVLSHQMLTTHLILGTQAYFLLQIVDGSNDFLQLNNPLIAILEGVEFRLCFHKKLGVFILILDNYLDWLVPGFRNDVLHDTNLWCFLRFFFRFPVHQTTNDLSGLLQAVFFSRHSIVPFKAFVQFRCAVSGLLQNLLW